MSSPLSLAHNPTFLLTSTLAMLVPIALGSAGYAQRKGPVTQPPPEVDRSADSPGTSQRFAILGDFGFAGQAEYDVSQLVRGFDPDWILTVGDNNYPSGEAATIDQNIGAYYHDYIHPYLGIHGSGADENRFFPALGNHDWQTPDIQPYLDYFTLPGNERYYDVRRNGVHFFIVDSDPHEPDGIAADSVQGQWLQNALAGSDALYKLVLMHHAPYSSARHGPSFVLQWPYREWGADAVIAGHDHVYERLNVGGTTYFVNGLGGRQNLYEFRKPIAGSLIRFEDEWGAQLIEQKPGRLQFRFVSRDGIVQDDFSIFANDESAAPEVLVEKDAVWRYLDNGLGAPPGWQNIGFADGAWKSGPAQFGYGEGDEATIVEFGPDPDDKFVTTYFRHEFQVTDLASINRFFVAAQVDDGAAVYLNGTELYRTNLPAGALSENTLATEAISAAPEDSFYAKSIDPALLVSGTNVIAAEVHQSGVASSDLSFALQVYVRRNVETLLPAGSVWSYLDDGSDPGPKWFKSNFDDSSWDTGPAQLGYGEADEATTIDFGTDPLNKHITSYFRTEFNVLDPDLHKAVILRLVRDDGAVVYLNGVEVHRFGLPLGPITSTTQAGALVAGSNESRLHPSQINPELLRVGTNVLAVEIHQDRPSSSDLSFDLELLGRP